MVVWEKNPEISLRYVCIHRSWQKTHDSWFRVFITHSPAGNTSIMLVSGLLAPQILRGVA